MGRKKNKGGSPNQKAARAESANSLLAADGKSSKEEPIDSLATSHNKQLSKPKRFVVSAAKPFVRCVNRKWRSSPRYGVVEQGGSACTSVGDVRPGEELLDLTETTSIDSAYESRDSETEASTRTSVRSEAGNNDEVETTASNLATKKTSSAEVQCETLSTQEVGLSREHADEQQNSNKVLSSVQAGKPTEIVTGGESTECSLFADNKDNEEIQTSHRSMSKILTSLAKPMVRIFIKNWKREKGIEAVGQDGSSDQFKHSVTDDSIHSYDSQNCEQSGYADVSSLPETELGITAVAQAEESRSDSRERLTESQDVVSIQAEHQALNAGEQYKTCCHCEKSSKTSLLSVIATATYCSICNKENIDAIIASSQSLDNPDKKDQMEMIRDEQRSTSWVKITKIGKDCTWMSEEGDIFEEIKKPTRFNPDDQRQIINIGRNTWRTDDGVLFEKLQYLEDKNRNQGPVCVNDDVSNRAELRKGDNAVIGFKKDVSESPAFIDQHIQCRAEATIQPEPESYVEKEDESDHMPQQINRPDILISADSPDSMTGPEQLNENFNYSRLLDIDIDDVIGDLQRDESRTNEPAVGLDDLIDRVADEQPNIQAPVWTQDHRDPYKVLLQGPHLELIGNKIKLLIKTKFPQYEHKVVVSGHMPEMFTENGLPLYTKQLGQSNNQRQKTPMYLTKETYFGPTKKLKKTIEENKATFGVFLNATTKGSPYGTTFTVSAGHSLLSNEQCIEMALGDEEKRHATWQDVVGKVKTDSHLSVAPHNGQPFNIKEVPLLQYRHYIPSQTGNPEHYKDLLWHDKFIADDLALQMEKGELINRGWTGDCLQRHISYTPLDGEPAKPIDIAGMIKIKEPRHLGMLLNVKVSCAGIPGVIRPHITSITKKGNGNSTSAASSFQLAHHIAFDTDQPLLKGNSGSPVFVYDEKKKVAYIVAILLGSFDSEKTDFGHHTVYQATPLYPLLARLQHYFPIHIGNISLVCPNQLENEDCMVTEKRLKKERNRYDSGYDSTFPISPTRSTIQEGSDTPTSVLMEAQEEEHSHCSTPGHSPGLSPDSTLRTGPTPPQSKPV